MIQNNEPYLIEYNVRMGDPECQVILPRLKTDLVQLLKNATNNKLKTLSLNGVRKMYDVVCVLRISQRL